jgi:dTMP kinase
MNHDKRGRFITLEGSEGAGKSTMMSRTKAWLIEAGHEVPTTREPGGTPLAETIRGLVLDATSEDEDPPAALTELLLVFASRAQHLGRLVRPSLEKGITVLCDRFTDSTWAYQGGGRQMPDAWVSALEELVHGDLQPDLTLLLDVDVETGLSRASNRSDPDWFESEQSEFFQRVRSVYLERAKAAPERFAIIDASRDEESVWAQIEECLEGRLGR